MAVVRGERGANAGRLPGLDLVRASAIAWVVLYHASIFWHVPGDASIVRFGWMGVDMFFTLSGFLIGGQLLRPRARGAEHCWWLPGAPRARSSVTAPFRARRHLPPAPTAFT